MPYAPETWTYDPHSGTAKIEAGEQIVNLFRFPGLFDLEPVLRRVYKAVGRGRKPPQHVLPIFAMAVAARTTRSLSEACRLTRNHVWEKCRESYREATGGDDIPTLPPTRDDVQYLRRRLAAKPELIEELLDTFSRSAIQQAQHLGNIRPDTEPNWAKPDARNVIYGDGTFITPYSDVRQIVDPVTGEVVLIGSKAKVRAPVVADTAALTDGTVDGKNARGINHVALYTWTDAGRVVLSVGQASGSEGTEALRLVENVAQIAGGGIHTLVYDRAITGWHTEYLLAKYRIQTIGKSVARRDGKTADEIQPYDVTSEATLNEMADREAAEIGCAPSRDLRRLLTRRVLDRIFDNGGRQYVGATLYPVSDQSYDVVHGKIFRLKAVDHPTNNGICTHDLVIDDGALYTATANEEDGWLMKGRNHQCLSSIPSRRAGRWQVTNTWLVDCPNGNFEYVTTWAPELRRGPSTNNSDEVSLAAAMRELRPLSRADGARFTAIFGRRSDAEAYNAWHKRSLPHHGRAASLRPEQQAIDFLAGAVLNNSNTWARAQ